MRLELRRTLLVPVALAAAMSTTAAAPAQGLFETTRPAPIAHGFAALPRIARPADAAQRAVNAALARADAAMPAEIAGCKADAAEAGVGHGYWTRTVTVTMAGRGFLSLLVGDDTFCGGAYPNAGVWALVFDLASGRQADWARLLGSRLAAAPAADEAVTGLKTGQLSSARLFRLYLQGYGAAARGADPDCRGVLEEQPDPPPLSVWPDAAKGALMVEPVLPHVIAACAVPVPVSAAALKAEGAEAALTSALERPR